MASLFLEGAHARLYALSRFNYDNALIKNITKFLNKKSCSSVADIGCGSGQFSHLLCSSFDQVYGIDVSLAQLTVGQKRFPSVQFIQGCETQIPLKHGSVDLITVAQAAHWFDLPIFYEQVHRCLRPSGVLALVSYRYPAPISFIEGVQDPYNMVIATLKEWFDHRRYMVDTAYRDVKLPYAEQQRIGLDIRTRMTRTHFTNYVESSSAFQAYRSAIGVRATLRIRDLITTMYSKAGVAEDEGMEFNWRTTLLQCRKP